MMDNCDIRFQHITVKHVPFIVVAIAVCFGLKGVMLKWIFKSQPISKNYISLLHLIGDVESMISFLITAGLILFDLSTIGRFPPTQDCRQVRIFSLCFICSLIYGGIPIVTMRLLLITCTDVVRILGERRIAWIIIAIWQFSLAGNIALISTTLDDANLENRRTIIGRSNALLAIFELSSNLWVGYFIFKSDLSMEPLLSKASIRRRRRMSSINFLGYLLHFVLEFLMLGVAILFLQDGMTPLIAYIYFYPILSLTSMVFNKPVQDELIMTCRSLYDGMIAVVPSMSQYLQPLIWMHKSGNNISTPEIGVSSQEEEVGSPLHSNKFSEMEAIETMCAIESFVGGKVDDSSHESISLEAPINDYNVNIKSVKADIHHSEEAMPNVPEP